MYLGPVGYVLARVDQVMQGVGVPDVRSGDLDMLPWLRHFGRHEPRARGAVIGEWKFTVLRDDLNYKVRAAVARASLVRVGRRQQAPVGAAQMQLDMNISVRLLAHAIDSAAPGDAAFLDV